MTPDEDKQKKLDEALYTLAIGATVEEIGKDEKGATKVFKRKLPPNLDAIKYLKEKGGTPDNETLTPWIPNFNKDDD